MKYTILGKTKLKVSKICLGTMTWGEQNTEKEAHEQMDYATQQAGINFMDAAEMYPVPGKAETQGRTEQYIGSWLQKRKNRDKIILASKVTGPSGGLKHIRNPLRFTREQIKEAINNNLTRLQTDYLDLYQLHWPERKANFFGKLGFPHDAEDDWQDNFLEVLESLNELVKAGKVRHIGVSNETPWGLMRYLEVARRHKLPEMATIQNPYSLLNRTFEVGLSEIAIRENVPLLAYSPLAFGLLTGKYFSDGDVSNARLTLFPKFSRYNGEVSRQAAREYVELAHESGMSPSQMALAYINTRPFLGANIIGATSMLQLKENIESINTELPEDVLEKIEEIHLRMPNPAP